MAEQDFRTVAVVRKGQNRSEHVPFWDIREGDWFSVNGYPLLAAGNAHMSGDSSYAGLLVDDTNGDCWLPSELDA